MRIPPFRDEFLELMAVSFRKRSKAISHMTAATVEVDKVYREVESHQHETLEFNLWNRTGDPTLKIIVWHDRWVWLDARAGSKRDGWLWEWNFNGRLLGDKSGKDFVEAAEKTIWGLHSAKKGLTDHLNTAWSPLLARGPKAIS
jgi:hypothetical protein